MVCMRTYMFIKRSWILVGDSLALVLALRWWAWAAAWPLKPSSFSFSLSVDSECLMAARLPLGRSCAAGEGSSRGAEMATTGMGSSRFTSGSEWKFMSMAQGRGQRPRDLWCSASGRGAGSWIGGCRG